MEPVQIPRVSWKTDPVGSYWIADIVVKKKTNYKWGSFKFRMEERMAIEYICHSQLLSVTPNPNPSLSLHSDSYFCL